MSIPVYVYVGVDVGGTNLRAVSLTALGDLGEPLSEELDDRGGAAGVVEQISSMIERALGGPTRRPAAIGLAVTGPVDIATGVVSNPWTLPSLSDVDIRRPFVSRFSVPVVIENDADAAGLGESVFGAGAGVDVLVMVTVGTGIGVALIRDGEVFRGARAYHQEAGHHAVADEGPLCYCGLTGCWEQFASGTALERKARSAVREGRWSSDRAITSAADVTAAADAGDPMSLELIGEVGFYLGRGLRNIEAFYAPERIIIGGGLGVRFDLLAPGIERGRLPASGLSRRADVVGSALGDAAGAIGAAYAARRSAQP